MEAVDHDTPSNPEHRRRPDNRDNHEHCRHGGDEPTPKRARRLQPARLAQAQTEVVSLNEKCDPP